jgi:hypothetical protein
VRGRSGAGRFLDRATEGIGINMAGSAGRKTVSVSRGLMMLCEVCYDEVYNEKLPDARNFIADHEALFDTICMGCTDINRPLIDDMLGSSE